jgi:hypothetical protein
VLRGADIMMHRVAAVAPTRQILDIPLQRRANRVAADPSAVVSTNKQIL